MLSTDSPYTIKHASVVKPDNDVFEDEQERPNEDYCHIKREGSKIICSIADGAGGTGIYAAKWAELLCKKLPSNAFTQITGIDLWLNTFWEEFYNEQLKKSEGGFFSIKNKFLDEGSSAALLSLWLDGLTGEYQWVSYGDTCLFCYDTLLKSLDSYPYKNITDFEENPYLLNWIHDQQAPQGFQTGLPEQHLRADQCLLLASDALAQYILIAYQVTKTPQAPQHQLYGKLKQIYHAHQERNQGFEQTLQELIDNLDDEKCFKQHCYHLYEQNLIKRDDYSLIMIQKSQKSLP